MASGRFSDQDIVVHAVMECLDLTLFKGHDLLLNLLHVHLLPMFPSNRSNPQLSEE